MKSTAALTRLHDKLAKVAPIIGTDGTTITFREQATPSQREAAMTVLRNFNEDDEDPADFATIAKKFLATTNPTPQQMEDAVRALFRYLTGAV